MQLSCQLCSCCLPVKVMPPPLQAPKLPNRAELKTHHILAARNRASSLQ